MKLFKKENYNNMKFEGGINYYVQMRIQRDITKNLNMIKNVNINWGNKKLFSVRGSTIKAK